jgi:cytochrome c
MKRKRHDAMARIIALLLCTGCIGSYGQPPDDQVPMGGSSSRGREIVHDSHCGVCHAIPGVRGAEGVVAAPLQKFALRTYIDGRLPNTPENLTRWIEDPRGVDAHTAMPAVGLTHAQARDVAAFLYTLR